MQNDEEPAAAAGASGLSNGESLRSPPAPAPRRPKPGILRLDIGKPRRSSGGSVDFRCVGSSSSNGNTSNVATGANSEVSEHDLRPIRECLRFGLANNDMLYGMAISESGRGGQVSTESAAATANSHKHQSHLTGFCCWPG
ncbi:GM25158 [Drosophila sechellia]|uniref:GM25158 n=1 Tax=Drosophila sechellia TaxID=7238 RepID=B4HL68_DROSE|nr:GM25158 [Drosophila sechellia]